MPRIFRNTHNKKKWNRTQRYVDGKAGRIGKPIPTDPKFVPKPRSNPRSARRASRNS